MKPLYDLWHGIRAAFTDMQVLSLLLINLILITGAAIFYHLIEGWKLLDAVYFSVVTIATVGYGDLTPQTALGKIFTIGYLMIGLGVFVAAAGSIADAIIIARKERREMEDDK